MSIVHRSTLVLCALAATSLVAQQASKLEVSASVIQGTNAYTRMTNNSTGYGVAAHWKFNLPQPNFDMRVSLAYNSMPGKTFITSKTSLKHLQLSADVYMDTWTKDLTWFMGISGNKYSASNSGYEIMGTAYTRSGAPRVNAIDAFSVRSGEEDKGLKLGLRIGLNYAFTPNWALEVIFQQTELGGGFHVEPNRNADGTPDLLHPLDPKYPAGYSNRGVMNPSWFNVGVKYTF